MAHGAGLLFDLIARDGASPAFLKVAGAADKAAAATARAQKGIATSSAALSRTGAKLTKSLTLPLAAAAAVSINEAAKYQKSLNTIQVATDQTNRQMAASSNGLLALSKSTGTGLGQLTDGLYTVEKAGLRGAKALAVVKAAAQGARAENADLGVVTDGLTSIMASYGSKLRDPVKAMNMIVKGSGLAKTTIQDFTASLSNVVPIASSLGISFADVGGAIATMTQHGETAQRATDNLSNLITNLAGQNNVAAAALGQMGINTVELSSNLGRRGLVGTLNTVLGAMSKMKDSAGRVVVDSFKKSATASASLKDELAAMPPLMRKHAQAFDAGSMSYKNFNAYAKSLGAGQSQMAKDFMATETQANGFNRQLKSGQGNVRSWASTLQKALGGVTGMRTALMLSGESAHLFAENSKEIGTAAEKSGADVLGWNKTQGLFTTKTAMAAQSLHVMAVEIGTALIPAVSKVVDWISTAVHWFDGLSGGTKKFIGYTALAVAALGPLLTIAGRVGKVLGLMWAASTGAATFIAGVRGAELSLAAMETRAYGAGLKIRSTFAGMSAGAQAASSVIAGALIGTVIGAMTQTSSTAVKTGGVIASALLGAASGFAMSGGNPLVAAIGGITGLLASAATAFHLFGGSAKAQVKPTDDFTAAIQRDNGALGANTQLLVANKLQKDGAYDAGVKLGIGQKLLTDAMMGSKSALGQVNLALEAGALRGGKFTDAASKLSHELPVVAQTLKVNQQAADNLSAALGHGKQSADATTGSLQKLGSVKAVPTIHIDTNDARIKALALVDWLNSLTATVHVTSDASFGGSVLRTGTTGTGIARASGGYVSGPGTATSDSIPARLSNGEFVINAKQTAKHRGLLENINKGAKGFANGGPVGNAAAISSALRSAFHFTRNQIAGFLGNFQVESRMNPKAYNPRENAHGIAQWEGSRWTALQRYAKHMGLQANSMAAQTGFLVKELRGSGIVSKVKKMKDPAKVAAYVDAHYERSAGTTRGAREAAARQFARNGAAAARGGGAGTSSSSRRHGRPNVGRITTGTLDGREVWIFGGKKYASLREAQNARAAAVTKAEKAGTSRVQGALGAVGQAPSRPFDINQVGYKTVSRQLAHARVLLDNADLTPKARASLTRQYNRALALAHRERRELRLKIRTTDLKAISKAVGGTADDIRSSFQQVITDLRNEGASAGQIARVRRRETATVAANNKYVAAKDYSSGIKSTLAGGFDPTHFGSVQDMIAGFQGQTTQNNSYAKELTKLRREAKGNKSELALINSLAASGQTASLESLAQGSTADLGAAAKAYSGYNASLQTGADAATKTKYGKTADQLHSDVETMVQHTDKIVADMVRTVTHLAHAVGTAHQHSSHMTDRQIDHALSQMTTLAHHGRH